MTSQNASHVEPMPDPYAEAKRLNEERAAAKPGPFVHFTFAHPSPPPAYLEWTIHATPTYLGRWTWEAEAFTNLGRWKAFGIGDFPDADAAHADARRWTETVTTDAAR